MPQMSPQVAAAILAANQSSGLGERRPSYLGRVAGIESSYNPSARNPSGAAGLFQFIPSTANSMGLADPYDPAAASNAAAKLTLQNETALTKRLGRAPTDGELYLAHQQGQAGAGALLSSPDANVVDALSAAYGGNRAKAARAITANGGSTDMLASDFSGKWVGKVDGSGLPPTNVAAPTLSPGATSGATPSLTASAAPFGFGASPASPPGGAPTPSGVPAMGAQPSPAAPVADDTGDVLGSIMALLGPAQAGAAGAPTDEAGPGETEWIHKPPKVAPFGFTSWRRG